MDGDLLLQLNEPMLTDDIGIRNGILRRRFMRELAELKQITDYSSCDPTNMCAVLSNLGPDYARYTYSLLQSGIDRFNLSAVNEEVLLHECHIENSIHRLKLLEAMAAVKELPSPVSISGLVSKTLDEAIKSLDVFISYRRSNGSQLARQVVGFSLSLFLCSLLLLLTTKVVVGDTSELTGAAD